MSNDDSITNVSNQLLQLQKSIEALKKTEATNKKSAQFVKRPYLQEQYDMNVNIKEKAEKIVNAIKQAKEEAEKRGDDATVDLEPDEILNDALSIPELVKNRNKYLQIAERAPDGFKAVERYRQSGKIGENEEDEKAIQAAIKPPKEDEGRTFKRNAEASYGPPAKQYRSTFTRFRVRQPFRSAAPGFGASYGYSGFQGQAQVPQIIIQPPQPGPLHQQQHNPQHFSNVGPRPSGGPKPNDQCKRCSALGDWANWGCPYAPGYNGVW